MRDFGMAGDWLLARSPRLLGLEGRAGDLIALLLGHLEKALALAGIGAAAAIRGARALALAGIRSHASPHGVVGMRGSALSRDGHDEGGYGYRDAGARFADRFHDHSTFGLRYSTPVCTWSKGEVQCRTRGSRPGLSVCWVSSRSLPLAPSLRQFQPRARSSPPRS